MLDYIVAGGLLLYAFFRGAGFAVMPARGGGLGCIGAVRGPTLQSLTVRAGVQDVSSLEERDFQMRLAGKSVGRTLPV